MDTASSIRPSLSAFHVYQTRDDLPEHLQDCHSYEEPFDWFHHPFYVGFFPLLCPMPLEDFIQYREEAAQQAYRDRNWTRYLLRHERGWRIDRLIEIGQSGVIDTSNKRDCIRFWRCAAWAWTDAELPEDDPRWSTVLDLPIPWRSSMSGCNGRRLLRDLPETITVYRGVHARSSKEAKRNIASGIQWSLSRKTARFFARRFLPAEARPFIAVGSTRKEHILAVLLDRGESEIVVPQNHIEIEQITVVK